MNLFEIAWQWTVLLLAEILNASASIVGFLRSSEVQLRQDVSRHLDRAACGADGFVSKPVRMPKLTAIIERLVPPRSAAANG